MPNRDGTGPYGEGPATGAGMGRCASRGQRRGFAGQGGRGRGFGAGRWNNNQNTSVTKEPITQTKEATYPKVESIQETVVQKKEQEQTVEEVKAERQDPVNEKDEAE